VNERICCDWIFLQQTDSADINYDQQTFLNQQTALNTPQAVSPFDAKQHVHLKQKKQDIQKFNVYSHMLFAADRQISK